jgi:hypothetical protein
VVGPGGIGKTRLVLEWLTSQAVPVAFVDLSGVDGEDGLCSAVVREVGLSLDADRTAGPERVAEHMAGLGRLLLVLDKPSWWNVRRASRLRSANFSIRLTSLTR